MTVYFKELPQGHAIVAAAEAVGAETDIAPRHVRPDLVREGPHVVRGCDDRSLPGPKAFSDIALAGSLRGVQQAPALRVQAVATQLIETRTAPDIREHTEILLQQVRPRNHLAQDCAATEQLYARSLFLPGIAQEIHSTPDSLFSALRHCGVGIVLVHQRDVVVDVLLVLEHASQSILDDDCNLVSIGRIVRNAVGNGGGEQVTVAILVLQSFAVEGGSTGGTA